MRRLAQLGLALAVVALLASPALAQRQGQGQRQRQGGGAGGGPLVMNKDVQKDLKLTEDQVTALTAAGKKRGEAIRGLPQDLSRQERGQKTQELDKEFAKVVKDTLKTDQNKRLHQLELQQRGLLALATPANARNPNPPPNPVAKELNITDEQKEKINKIGTEAAEKRRELFQGGAGNQEENRKKMTELTKNANEKIMGVLTADQKTKWKEMTGEPFKGTLPPAGFGGAQPRRPGGGARPPI